MSFLEVWSNFFIIVGSSAGALVGLQFVMMTLIAERSPPHASEANPAFATPTIVHFGAVLLLSAVMTAPWGKVWYVSVVLGLIGLVGAVYAIHVSRHIRVQSGYEPEFGDWLYYALLPLAAYVVLALSALAALFYTSAALFGVGAAAVLLLFIGIHNAWDSIVYLALYRQQNIEGKQS